MVKFFKSSDSTTKGIKILSLGLLVAVVFSVYLSSPNLGPIDREANAAKFLFRTNQGAFSTGDTLVVYGKGVANDTLVVRLVDPSGKVLRIDLLKLDKDGIFTSQLFVWPPPSNVYPYGIYTLQINSSVGGADTQEVPVIFTQSAVPNQIPQHTLAAKLDSPTEVSSNSTFRIFVQVTFDGALVIANATDLLGSSHLHSANVANQTISLGKSFVQLHEGLFYADVRLPQEGTYIIHAIAFYRGYLAHDSKVITVSNSSINSIQQTVNELNAKLNSTNNQIGALQSQLERTNRALNETGSTLSNSVENARSTIATDIKNLYDASGQLNSIILPILALISIIIALQISLFARIRASYK